jgi:diaminopimelate epimerase
MRFTKMHGAGNDYVFVDCFAQPVPGDPAGLARRVADRHFGVGGDGLVLICPSDRADARMRMFNADGSEAEMCGNGIRCVAKYLYDHGLCRRERLAVETGAGVLSLDLMIEGDRVRRVRVDMGQPILTPAEIPTTLPGNPLVDGNSPGDGSPVVDVDLAVAGRTLKVTCVSMGNPHCVTFVEKLSDEWVLGLGPKVEVDGHFPNRVNAEFVEVVSPAEVRVRVWERGSGETLACGTGACAVCVAGVLSKRTARKVLAHLPGGDLELHWAEDNHVYLTGEAVEVFSGEWPGD